MAWQMNTEMIECCSCKLLCPCWIGPEGEPDQGWCGGALVFSIDQGTVDGVDVGGCRSAVAVEWPGNFFAGNGTARVYVDERASADQRRELEAVFSGKRGGLFEGLMGAVVAKWLPAKTVPFEVSRGDSITITVGDAGKVVLKRLADEQQRPVSVQGMRAQAAFQSPTMDLASAKGTRWADPDIRPWDGDSGTLHRVSWSF